MKAINYKKKKDNLKKNSPRFSSMYTSMGKVYFRSGALISYPLQTSFLRLQELHYRSLGAKRNYRLGFISSYSKSFAKTKFLRSISTMLSMLNIHTYSSVEKFFLVLIKYVSISKTLDGLESIYLTCLNSTGRSGNRNLFNEGMNLWNKIGAPKFLGGNSVSSLILDKGLNAVGALGNDLINTIGMSFAFNSPRTDLSPLNSGFLGGAVQGGVIPRNGGGDEMTTETQCTGMISLAGGVVGGIVGGVGGGAAGTVVEPGGGTAVGGAAGAEKGFELGALGGGILGAIICDWIVNPTPNEDEGGGTTPADGDDEGDGGATPTDGGDEGDGTTPADGDDEGDGTTPADGDGEGDGTTPADGGDEEMSGGDVDGGEGNTSGTGNISLGYGGKVTTSTSFPYGPGINALLNRGNNGTIIFTGTPHLNAGGGVTDPGFMSTPIMGLGQEPVSGNENSSTKNPVINPALNKNILIAEITKLQDVSLGDVISIANKINKIKPVDPARPFE